MVLVGEWSMMTVRSLHSRTPMTTARNDAVPTLKLKSFFRCLACAWVSQGTGHTLLSVAPIDTLKGVGSIFPDHRQDVAAMKPRVATQ